MMKRAVGFLISICMLVTCVTYAFALSDDIIKLSLSGERVKPGESIELTVSAEAEGKFRGIQFMVTYDIGKLIFAGTERGSLAQEALAVSVDDGKPGKITAALVFEDACSLNDDIIRLKFNVRNKTGVGDTKISVKNTELVDEDNNTSSAENADAVFEIYSDAAAENTFPPTNITSTPKPFSTDMPTSAPSTPQVSAPSGGSGSGSRPAAAATAVPDNKSDTASGGNKDAQADKKGCNFNDIAGHWAAEDIVYLYNKGIIDGLSDEEFAPEKKVTRAEFVKMISMIAQFAPTDENPFVDVSPDDWYYEPVLKGYSSGIINGYGKEFAPNKNITREEMAVIADRCMEYMGKYSETGETDERMFSDQESLSEWSVRSVIRMARAGVINGIGGAFVPGADTTRAQAAVVIKRISDIEKNTTPKYFSSITLSPDRDYFTVDGVTEEIDVVPFYNNGLVYAALDDLAKYFESELTSDGKDFCIAQGEMKAYGNVESDILSLHYEQNPLFDKQIYMNNKCRVTDGHICMPVDFIVQELFASNVFWNEETDTASVTRPYQTKRLLISTDDDFKLPSGIPYKEAVQIADNIWTMQFEADMPDVIVKEYEDFLTEQVPGIKTADPDIVLITP